MSKTTFSTRNAAGKSYTVQFWGGTNDHWEVTVTDDNTLVQDHGCFEVQEGGLFGCSELNDTDSDDWVMIQNEIAKILADNEYGDSPFSPHDLLESDTNNLIRKATWNEARESARESAEGHIVVGGVRCYVEMRDAEIQRLREETARA